jgi:hypothetical protein
MARWEGSEPCLMTFRRQAARPRSGRAPKGRAQPERVCQA